MKKPTDPQEMWKKLQQELPKPDAQEQKRLANEWLLKGAEDSESLAAQATAKAIFDDRFYGEMALQEAEKTVVRKPLLRQLWVATTAVAAMLALGFYLFALGGQGDAYSEVMAQATKPDQSEVAMLGGNYEVYEDLSKLPQAEAGGFVRVAVPENAVTVSNAGVEEGVKYYNITQNGNTYTVLTELELPEVGSVQSFNAKLFWVEGMPILVEEVRHEVF